MYQCLCWELASIWVTKRSPVHSPHNILPLCTPGPIYPITLPPGCLNDLSFFNIPLPPQLRKRVLLMHLSTSETQLTLYSHPNFECTSSVQMALISTLLLCYLFSFLCSDIHCDVYLNGLIGYLFWL